MGAGEGREGFWGRNSCHKKRVFTLLHEGVDSAGDPNAVVVGQGGRRAAKKKSASKKKKEPLEKTED